MQRFAQYLPKNVLTRWSRNSPLYPLEWKRPDAIVYVALGVSLLLGIWVTYQLNFTTARPGPSVFDDPNILGQAFIILYWPIVILQIAAHIIALNSPVRSVLSRLSPFLLLLIGVRIFFVAAMLINLSEFQGRYLDLLLSGTIPFGSPNISPTASSDFGIFTVALTIQAVLWMPITSLLLDASLGTFLNTLKGSRAVQGITRVCLVVARVAIIVLGLWVGAGALSFNRLVLTPGATPAYEVPDFNMAALTPMWQYWGGAFLGVSEGDQGLTLLHAPYLGRLWADIDYGVLVNIALAGYCLLQFFAVDLLLKAIHKRTPPPEIRQVANPTPSSPPG